MIADQGSLINEHMILSLFFKLKTLIYLTINIKSWNMNQKSLFKIENKQYII